MVHEFQYRHLGSIAPATIGNLQYPGIPASSRLVTSCKFSEELGHDLVVTSAGECKPSRVKGSLLTQSDQSIHHTTNFLRLLNGGRDLFLVDHAISHVTEHSQSVGCISAKL